MGILKCYGMSYIHHFTNKLTGPYVLRPNSQSLPDQTFNETEVMAIGRESGLPPHPGCVSEGVGG